MENRIKKLTSWSVPVVAIAAVSVASFVLISGNGLGFGNINPKQYAAQLGFLNVKSFFASVSDSLQHLGSSAFPAVQKDDQGSTPPDNSGYASDNSGNPAADSSFAPNTPLSGGSSDSGTQSTVTQATSSGTGTSGLTKTPPANIPAGPADLAIQILDTGILDSSNAFVHATKVESGQKGAVVFEVKNIGGSRSPQWIFSANIPIPDSSYVSAVQSALAPGEAIRFTMAFSNLNQNGLNQASFIVDPNNQVPNDPNRNNNTASATLYRDY